LNFFNILRGDRLEEKVEGGGEGWSWW